MTTWGDYMNYTLNQRLNWNDLRSMKCMYNKLNCSKLILNFRPPNGCLQYWTTLTGRMTTFHFFDATHLTTATGGTSSHLPAQRFHIINSVVVQFVFMSSSKVSYCELCYQKVFYLWSTGLRMTLNPT